jgi:hypothetical protein
VGDVAPPSPPKKNSVGGRRKSPRIPSTQPNTVLTAATAEETGSPDTMKNQSEKPFSRRFAFGGRFAKRHRASKFSNSHALRVTSVFVQGKTELHIVSRRENYAWIISAKYERPSENILTMRIFSVIYLHLEYEQI